MTNHLVSGLRSSANALDQSKVSFGIQELLKILDRQFGGSKDSPTMTQQLKEKLQEAGVINVVEPFWSSNYQQNDTKTAQSPPFFGKSKSYYSWLSSFCRYLITRSNANKRSVWRDFFHACRSVIRSRSGVGVAEYLLPLFVLDAITFGDKSDDDIVCEELLNVLTFSDGDDSSGVVGSTYMTLREREKAANSVFSIMDVLRHWMESEIERMNQSSRGGRSKRTHPDSNDGLNSWPAATSMKKIERLLNRIPLASCANAAHRTGMRAKALQFLEMEGRKNAGANEEGMNQKDEFNGTTKFLKSHFLEGIDTQLIQMILGQLNDFDTMVFVAQKSQQTNLRQRLTEEAAERELYEDWEGACQSYEQLLDSRLDHENEQQSSSVIDNTKASVQEGLLRCLLKLGRLDNVMNQAFGMSHAEGNDTHIRAELLPSAAEAAWRLGNWSVLDSLVNHSNDESEFDANASYQLSFGRIMASMHDKSHARVISCLRDSREFTMTSLSSAARDGYTRSYPYLMQLHSLREVEKISSVYFDDQSNSQKSFVDTMSSDQWKDRLELSTPDITGSNPIINTRLALSRMANEPSVEGSMWLDIGKMARKGGLYQVAEHSLSRANVSFCNLLTNTSDSHILISARECIGRVKLQVAKLKHDVGESMTALNLIEDGIPASVFLMDKKQLKSYVSSDSIAESGEVVARRILQATEWMVCDGLKSSAEIKDRYQTVLNLAPNWERGMNKLNFISMLS